MANSIKYNFFFNILFNISKVIFPLITAPYVARVLEPDGVGLFNFANTYASNFALFAALGIPLYGIREIAKCETLQDKTRFVSEMISVSIFTTLMCSILYIASLFFINQLKENYVLFLLAGLYLYVTPLRIDWYYAGIEEFKYITKRSLLIKALSVLLLFIFVHDKNDLIIYISLNTVCLILNDLWNYVKLLSSGIKPYFTIRIKKHIKPLFVLFASSVAISIYVMLDTLMLGFISDYEQVGYYNSASHIARVLLPIVTSLAAVAIPRLSLYMKERNWIQINTLINKSLSVVSFLSVPITIAIILVAPTFIPLFYGESFYGAVLPLQVMVLVVIIIGFNNLTGQQVLVALGYDYLFLCSVLSGTVSNFVLNIVLIPQYGAVGAAVASVFAEISVLLTSLFFIKKYTQITLAKISDYIKNIVVCLGFIPIFYLLDRVLESWILIAVFTLLGSLYYMLLQFAAKNSCALLIYQTICKRFKIRKI